MVNEKQHLNLLSEHFIHPLSSMNFQKSQTLPGGVYTMGTHLINLKQMKDWVDRATSWFWTYSKWIDW